MEVQSGLTRAMRGSLTAVEGTELCCIARRALEAHILEQRDLIINLAEVPERLRVPGASFVTVTVAGQLRGCIGTVEAFRPLAEDVACNAVRSATIDPRFPPMSPAELAWADIEVSVLGELQRIPRKASSDLLRAVQPEVDGVLLVRGVQQGLLLPQLWERLPDAETFLDHVCLKAGLVPGSWRDPNVEVYVFEVQAFHEQVDR